MNRMKTSPCAAESDRWIADKLNRKASADFLTSYLIKRYAMEATHDLPGTLTLNIRADWGLGKTFFLKRWSEDLQHVGYPVVFFDAWSNDFTDDPLVGFIAEMEKSLSPHLKRVPIAKRHLDQAIATGRRLIKPVGVAIASAVAKKVSGHSLAELEDLFSDQESDELAHSTDNNDNQTVTKSLRSDISKLAELALKEHLSKQETIQLFKRKLGRVVDSLKGKTSVQLPFFIFIDELDRCRPSYAIELLEAIKHLFGVPGIYFVVATNLEQLGHSIRALYGEGFDSEKYLKRFFDQEFMLPTPDERHFVDFLFAKYSLEKLGSYYSVIEKDLYPDEPPERTMFRLFSEAFSLSLRDQEQVALALQTILLS